MTEELRNRVAKIIAVDSIRYENFTQADLIIKIVSEPLQQTIIELQSALLRIGQPMKQIHLSRDGHVEAVMIARDAIAKTSKEPSG